jgi:membrane protein required for colicin V production
MNWVDIVLIIYLILSIVSGAAQGLIRSVLSFIGMIVGVVLAANYYERLAGSIFQFISNTTTANIVSFILIFGVVMILAGIIGTALRSVIKAIQLGWVDGLGGAAFGLVMGMISAGAILALLVKLTSTSLITDSLISAFLLDKFPLVLSFMPSEFDIIRDFFK